MNNERNIDKELISLLSLEIPEPEIKKEGFLDIAGVQYRENTITKIYAYFLDQNKNRDIADLFLESLTELVADKLTNEIGFDDYYCSLEYPTKKGGRIDLVILSSKNDSAGFDENTALIIENKIYHNVHNDLEDYYESIDAKSKAGVLLTLSSQKIHDTMKDYFVNITHKEWMEKIKSKGLPTDIPIELYVYLNDFITNMENLSKNNKMNEQARFFFNHTTKVLRAKETYSEAHSFIIRQLGILADDKNLKKSGNNLTYCHMWDEEKDSRVYYSIDFSRLLSSETERAELRVYIEVYKEAVEKKEELKNILDSKGFFTEGKLIEGTKSDKNYAHLAYKSYNLTLKDIEILSVFLKDKIENDLKGAYELIYEKTIKMSV